jgi:hypothetical protein
LRITKKDKDLKYVTNNIIEFSENGGIDILWFQDNYIMVNQYGIKNFRGDGISVIKLNDDFTEIIECISLNKFTF